jgi:hypothetical protein
MYKLHEKSQHDSKFEWMSHKKKSWKVGWHAKGLLYSCPTGRQPGLWVRITHSSPYGSVRWGRCGSCDAGADYGTQDYVRNLWDPIWDQPSWSNMYFAIPDSLKEQTVKEEYCSYVMASTSPPGTNILKFWEVCVMTVMSQWTTGIVSNECNR